MTARQPDESDVERAIEQQLHLARRRVLAQSEIHAGELAPERGDGREHEVIGPRCRESDSNATHLSLCGLTGRDDSGVDAAHDTPCLGQERLARLRQLDAAAGAIEQYDAKLPFEPTNRLTQRGLRHMQTLSSLSKAPEFGDRDELNELAKLHDRDQ